MAKKEAETVVEEKVNQPENAPIAPSDFKGPISSETLAHQWQANSPALDTNAASGYNPVNVVQQEKAAEATAEEEKKEAETLTKEEYERRTKLDVSDKDYINPSLGNYKVK